jgi:hypothetical protein
LRKISNYLINLYNQFLTFSFAITVTAFTKLMSNLKI